MNKKVGIIKRMFCLCLIFLLSINSFAAIVSDNDGSAFITKAEFDALKSSFQSQIDSYNQSIDSKIDGAIASYLAGIKLSTTKTVDTFLKNLNSDCKIIFVEKNNMVKGTPNMHSGIYGGINFGNFLKANPNGNNWLQAYNGGTTTSDNSIRAVNGIIKRIEGTDEYLSALRSGMDFKGVYFNGVYSNGGSWPNSTMIFYIVSEYKKENKGFYFYWKVTKSDGSDERRYWEYVMPQTWTEGTLVEDYTEKLLVGYKDTTDTNYYVCSESGELECNSTTQAPSLWAGAGWTVTGNNIKYTWYYNGSERSGSNGVWMLPAFASADARQVGDFYSLAIKSMINENKYVFQGCPIVTAPKNTTVTIDFNINTTQKVFFRNAEFLNDGAPTGNVQVAIDDKNMQSTSVAPTIAGGDHTVTFKNDTNSDFTLWIKPQSAGTIISKEAEIISEQ